MVFPWVKMKQHAVWRKSYKLTILDCAVFIIEEIV
jgi:hypothetical protein